MNKNNQGVSRHFLTAILVFSLLAGGTGMANAQTWSPPTASPPGNNVTSPLNTSGTAQSKIGGLLLNTGGSANGLIVQFGKMGIGTANPAALLHLSSTTPTMDLFKITAGSNSLVFTSLGKLGISTSTPSQALDVEGNVRAIRTHVDKVCNRAGLECLDFSIIYDAVTSGGGGSSTSSPQINSFSITPSPVYWGQNTTWSGTASGGSMGSANCITRHRAYVSGSTGGEWTNASDCPSPLTLNSIWNVWPLASNFYNGQPYANSTYTIIWEVQGTTQGVTAVRTLNVLAQGAPAISFFSASPATVIEGQNIAVNGTASPGTACITQYAVYFTNIGPGTWTNVSGCPSSLTLNSTLSSVTSPPWFGAHEITWTVKDQAGNQASKTASVDVWQSGGPFIDSYSVTPSFVQRPQPVTWSGSATRGSYCIVSHRAYVVNSSGGVWTNVPCVSSVTLDDTTGTEYEQSNFYNFYYDEDGGFHNWTYTYTWHNSSYGPEGTYTLRWEVKDQTGNVTSQDVVITVHD